MSLVTPVGLYAWATDTHFNMSLFFRRDLIDHVNHAQVDGFLLTGDISAGHTILTDLEALAISLSVPTYFVLGNHDYHRRSFDSVNQGLRDLIRKYPGKLFWLTEQGPISLVGRELTCLVGAEGWYDAAFGSSLPLTFDWPLISELRLRKDRLTAYRELATISTNKIVAQLEAGLRDHHCAYVLTHFPPWGQATHHRSAFWLSYDVNDTLGIALERIADERPGREIVVLCGHTHVTSFCQIRHNLSCRVMGSSYWHLNRPESLIFI